MMDDDTRNLIVEAFRDHYGLDDEGTVDTAGYTVDWRWRPDDMSPIEYVNDCDESLFGRLEWGRGGYDEPRLERPTGFNGNAERIDRYNPGVSQGDYQGLWWQPPSIFKRGTAEFEGARRSVIELLTSGLSYLTVTVSKTVRSQPCPHCHRHNVEVLRGEASLSGIESTADDAYKETVFSDLLDEVLAEIEPEEA